MKVDMKIMKKRAQSLIEYGLILALVAVVAIAVLQRLGKVITKSSQSAINQIEATTESSCASLTIDGVVECSINTNGVCECNNTSTKTPQ